MKKNRVYQRNFILKSSLKGFVLIIILVFSFSSKAADSIEEVKSDLNKVEAKLEKKVTEKDKILDGLQAIENNINSIKSELAKTSQLLEQYNKEIQSADERIIDIEKKIDQKKKVLGDYLRIFSQVEKERDLVLINSQENIGGYLRILEDYGKIHDKIKSQLLEINEDKEREEQERAIISGKREEQQRVYWMQDEQRGDLEFEEKRKKIYLNNTQKDINILTAEREELKKQLNALQSLGQAINLDEAIKIAQKVSGKTKVRTAFLLGVLRVESNMGQNVGGGNYKTDMNPDLHDDFKRICNKLGLDPKKMPVSRRVCYNKNSKDGCGGWGGAMGPAQFMPSTWLAYEDRVAKLTGNNPPNPWDLEDALTAMGIKLAGVPGVTEGKESAEKKAASMYLAGGAWQNYSWYGERVLYYAKGFEKYMEE